MDALGFWRIVDGCKRSEQPEAVLSGKLAKLAPDEIASFDEHLCDRFDDALTWDLWGAAYLIEGGCSDDGFAYFRYGLIAKGRTIFDLALQNPDSLVKVDVDENEEFGGVALDVYRELTGRELARATPKEKPRGRRWDFDDDAQCKAKLPKLARKVAIESFNELHVEAWQITATGDRAGANAIYARAIALLDPDDRHDGIPLVHANMMSNARALGAIAEARTHFAQARRLRMRVRDPAQRAILDSQIAWFAYESGTDEECTEALVWAHEASANAREPLPAMDTEARILLRLGREGAARAITKRALRLDPEFAPLQDLKARWKLD
ncbi:hypothetical protein BH09MYX1_BH09MYX1_48630 [soil metagenome]